MTRDEIIARFSERDAMWGRRDAVTLGATFAENAVAESPMQGRLEGRARITEVYAQWMTAFPDLTFKTEDLLVDGDRVVQFWTMTGTQAGTFGGLAATGRKFHVKGAVLSTLGPDGLIIHERRVYDVTNMLVQLGALRAKPQEESRSTVFRTT
jgi:steroid delta-isomerase-like uncharacterized protein